jgi:hypothetical protein
LCTDQDENFVVIELKRGKAPDIVVTQLTRYINWVKENLANDGQTVRRLIIAKTFDKRLWYTLTSRDDIDLLIYDWHLTLNRFTPPDVQTELSISSSAKAVDSFGGRE